MNDSCVGQYRDKTDAKSTCRYKKCADRCKCTSIGVWNVSESGFAYPAFRSLFSFCGAWVYLRLRCVEKVCCLTISVLSLVTSYR